MNVPSSNNPPPDPKAAFAALKTTTKVMTDKDWIRELLPVIKEKRAAGWSYEDIRAALAETVGFKGTLKTLYTYTCRLASQAPSSPAGPIAITTPSSEDVPLSPVPRRFKDSLDPEWVDAMKMRPKRKKGSMVEMINKPI